MKIKMYGADWCKDCIIAKKILNEKSISFEYIDITDNDQAISLVEKLNNGKRIIPTLLIDGKVFTNPGINELMKIIQ